MDRIEGPVRYVYNVQMQQEVILDNKNVEVSVNDINDLLSALSEREERIKKLENALRRAMDVCPACAGPEQLAALKEASDVP